MKDRLSGGLSDATETSPESGAENFIQSITDYWREQNHQSMVNLSNAVGVFYSSLRGGDFGEGQPKIVRNITKILEDVFSYFDWVEKEVASNESQLAMKIETLIVNVREGNPAEFAKNIVSIFGIDVGNGVPLIYRTLTPRPIDRNYAILKPKKHQSESVGVQGKGKARALRALDTSRPSRLQRRESKEEKDTQEVKQIIQDFRDMIWAIPYRIPGKLNTYSQLQYDLNVLEMRLSEITTLINRRKELRKLIIQTKQRVSKLQETSNTDKRKGKRVQRVMSLLEAREGELISIPIKKLQIQKSGLLKKKRKIGKKMKEIGSGLKYTEASLAYELFHKLDIPLEVANKDNRHIIPITELQSIYISLFRQIAPCLSENWDSIEDVANGDGQIRPQFSIKQMRVEMENIVVSMTVSLRKKKPPRKLYLGRKKAQ